MGPSTSNLNTFSMPWVKIQGMDTSTDSGITLWHVAKIIPDQPSSSDLDSQCIFIKQLDNYEMTPSVIWCTGLDQWKPKILVSLLFLRCQTLAERKFLDPLASVHSQKKKRVKCVLSWYLPNLYFLILSYFLQWKLKLFC